MLLKQCGPLTFKLPPFLIKYRQSLLYNPDPSSGSSILPRHFVIGIVTHM